MITNKYNYEIRRGLPFPDRIRALWHVLLGHPVCYEMRIAGSPKFLNGHLISGEFGDFDK